MNLINLYKKDIILAVMSLLAAYLVWDNFYLPWGLGLWGLSIFISKKILTNPFKNADRNSGAIIILFFITFFSLCVSLILSNNKDEGIVRLTQSLSLIVVPSIALYAADTIKKYHTLIIRSFAFSSVLAVLYSIILSGIKMYTSSQPTYSVSYTENIWGQYFYYQNFSHLMHPGYFALLLSFALLFFINDKNFRKISSIHLVIQLLSICIVTIGIYLSSSRAGIFSALIIIIIYAFHYVRKIEKKRFRYSAIVIFTVLIGLIFLNPRTQKKIVENYRYFYLEQELSPGAPPSRLDIWSAALQTAMRSPLTGEGMGDYREEMAKIIDPNSKETFNSHNQFIDYFVSSGIIALLLLILQIVAGIYTGIKKQQPVFTIFIVIVAINMLFESILFRITGIVFYTFFYMVLLFGESEEKNYG